MSIHLSISPEEKLGALYKKWSGAEATEILAMPQAGSDRRYFRLGGTAGTVVGAYNKNAAENHSFTEMTRQFFDLGVPVPELLAADLPNEVYLVQDLGDRSLLNLLMDTCNTDGSPSPQAEQLYRKALEGLAFLQTQAPGKIDESYFSARSRFDARAMQWDLNYFKYFFLKLAGIPFDEEALENDFQTLASFLMEERSDFFMFRDFQARNIMIHEDKPYFIDYQGGRWGALQYDLASLLFQAKARLPQDLRESLLEHYMDSLGKWISLDRKQFRAYFYGFVLIRLIQVLGAYGFRGLYERRSHFLESIPFGLDNIRWFLSEDRLPVKMPALMQTLQAMVESPSLEKYRPKSYDSPKLKVSIYSFSYKKGYPTDETGHGGGFVFDCRAMHNPGRYEPYKKQTGREQPVIEFLQKNSRIEEFLEDVYRTVDPSVERYLERGFDHLTVSFGCTGGQHRSVFSAEALTRHLKKKYPVSIRLVHREQDIEEFHSAE